MTADPRRVVGGAVWAKADAVSKDCKRIYGAQIKNKWLRGEVLEIKSLLKDGGKRPTTYIEALYTVGSKAKIKLLSLQTLKAEDPNAGATELSTESQGPPPMEPTAAATVPPHSPIVRLPIVATAAGDRSSDESSPERAILNEDEDSFVHDSDLEEPTATAAEAPHSVTVHDREWVKNAANVDINGPTGRQSWRMTCQHTGRDYMAGCDTQNVLSQTGPALYTAYDFFMAVFPMTQLKAMVNETSTALRAEDKSPTSYGEVLKWMGLVILVTRCEFGARSELWSTTSNSKYLPPYALGQKTGMSRQRFDDLNKYMVWSTQPATRPDHMSSEAYRWKRVDDFVARINQHRAFYFLPSWLICCDESISKWNGLGGSWINISLPMFIAMDRKPEDGCEIQNSCCGFVGILMRLKLVKSLAEEGGGDKEDANG